MNAVTPAQADALVGSTALSTFSMSGDAELIATVTEFLAAEDEIQKPYDDVRLSDEAATLTAEPFEAERDRLLCRLEALPATTMEGLAALTIALARHAGPDARNAGAGYAYGFDPTDGSRVGRLLDMTLRNAVAMIKAVFQPNAELLRVGGGALATTALTPVAGDNDLIALAVEYRGFNNRLIATLDLEPGSPEEGRVNEERTRVSAEMLRIEERAAALTATTGTGLVARAVVMGLNDPQNGCSYDTGILSDLMAAQLRDAAALAATLEMPSNDEADLLAFRPAFNDAVQHYDHYAGGLSEYEEDRRYEEADATCNRIIDSPAARTAEGRAMKAAAAMYALRISCYQRYVFNDVGTAKAWTVLQQIAGDLAPELNAPKPTFAQPGAEALPTAADDGEIGPLGYDPEVEKLLVEVANLLGVEIPA